jgi:hypothetical protein
MARYRGIGICLRALNSAGLRPHRFPGLRLASVDRTKLMTVAEARDVMKEANKAAWRAERQAEREQARPANWIGRRHPRRGVFAP